MSETSMIRIPKAHPARFFLAAGAIDALDKPTGKTIAQLTGLQESKVKTYIRQLVTDYGMDIEMVGHTYRIKDWGKLLKQSGIRAYLRDYQAGNLSFEASAAF